jgi:hypothetical protein
MKKYIIIPIVQTEGMYGYSAIAIELNEVNLKEINNLKNIFAKVKEVDKTINKIVYISPALQMDLLNDEFESFSDELHIETILDSDFDSYNIENECRVETPNLIVQEGELYIEYFAKWSDSKIYASLLLNELNKLNKTI